MSECIQNNIEQIHTPTSRIVVLEPGDIGQDKQKKRITAYWNKRSASFMEQRRHELHDPIAERWLREIRSMLPGDAPLRVLDVGCGTGFFTILLAKEGHTVTGVDLTENMVECAKELAAEEDAACDFYRMDAEHLAFADNSFDLVISRNLVWTLPHAETAYREWTRVLRQEGILINFDADYGAADETDTASLPKNHAHMTIGEDMVQENAAIKASLAISRYARPAWDVHTLGKFGMEQFYIDQSVGKRIYLKKDEFYNPTPIFMLRAAKTSPFGMDR